MWGKARRRRSAGHLRNQHLVTDFGLWSWRCTCDSRVDALALVVFGSPASNQELCVPGGASVASLPLFSPAFARKQSRPGWVPVRLIV